MLPGRRRGGAEALQRRHGSGGRYHRVRQRELLAREEQEPGALGLQGAVLCPVGETARCMGVRQGRGNRGTQTEGRGADVWVGGHAIHAMHVLECGLWVIFFNLMGVEV